MKNIKTWGVALLANVIVIAGCKQDNAGTKPSANKDEVKTVSSPEAHAHGIGPNGGIVFELGKYHAEFTVNHDKKECTVVVLSADEKNTQPIKVAAKELMLTTKETKSSDGKVIPRLTIKLLPKEETGSKGSIFVGSDASWAMWLTLPGWSLVRLMASLHRASSRKSWRGTVTQAAPRHRLKPQASRPTERPPCS
ncbi:MAG TPA: hypothetical protein PLN21_21785 [Gemmatales bacterium]|nr:hypothetical protein [Gemmatales bacterium]